MDGQNIHHQFIQFTFYVTTIHLTCDLNIEVESEILRTFRLQVHKSFNNQDQEEVYTSKLFNEWAQILTITVKLKKKEEKIHTSCQELM